MFDKFTEKARQAVLKAQEYVRTRQQQDVQVAHLMKGMLEVDESVVGYLLKKLGVNISDLNNKLDVIMDSYPKVYGAGNLGSHLSKEASLVIQNAQNLAKDFGDEFVAVDIILAGIFSVLFSSFDSSAASGSASSKPLASSRVYHPNTFLMSEVYTRSSAKSVTDDAKAARITLGSSFELGMPAEPNFSLIIPKTSLSGISAALP